jgi:hypothetical protein
MRDYLYYIRWTFGNHVQFLGTVRAFTAFGALQIARQGYLPDVGVAVALLAEDLTPEQRAEAERMDQQRAQFRASMF